MRKKRIEWKKEKQVKPQNDETKEQSVPMNPPLESIGIEKPNNLEDKDEDSKEKNQVILEIEDINEQSVLVNPKLESTSTEKPNNHDHEDEEGGGGVPPSGGLSFLK